MRVPGSETDMETQPVPAGIDAPNVGAWLSANIARATPPFAYGLITGGRSNLTFEVTDAAGAAMVLRRPPLGHLLHRARHRARVSHHRRARRHRRARAAGARAPATTRRSTARRSTSCATSMASSRCHAESSPLGPPGARPRDNLVDVLARAPRGRPRRRRPRRLRVTRATSSDRCGDGRASGRARRRASCR